MADEFKRGSTATVRATGRAVQVHHVTTSDGKTLLECKSLDRVPDDDGTYRPSDLVKLVCAAPVLPNESK